MIPHAQTLLRQRGIDTAALSAGWTHTVLHGTHYYRYPVYAPDSDTIVAYRLKALPNQTGAKYLWVTGKPADAAYYRHPQVNLTGAIAAAGGVLFIANGEPSVLAYTAAGVLNVVSWFGEGSVPASLAQDAQRWGVREVRYPADKDEAGRKSAAKVRDALRGTNIKFRALAWGDDVPERGDANDLWRVTGFDAAEFQRRLIGLSALILPENEPGNGIFRQGDPAGRPYNSPSPFGEGAGGEVNPDLIAAIAARLGVTAFRSNGWSSRNVLSPFRDEKRASAAFNRDSGVLHDFGTGESYGVRDVAEKLGIDWQAYQPHPLTPSPLAGRGNATRPHQTATISSPINGIQQSSSPVYGGGREGVWSRHPPQIIHQRWTSDLDPAEVLNHRTILLRAPMATGKTELVKRLMGHLNNPLPDPSPQAGRGAVLPARQEDVSPQSTGQKIPPPPSTGEAGRGFGVRILYINHLKSLTGNAAHRLDLEHYDSLPAEYLAMASSMAISYNSLHKLVRADGEVPEYDLLVVDECEQVQPYIGASTFKPGEALRNYGIFRRLCQQAKHVLFMDAHAGEINADWLQEVRGDCHVLHNTYRHNWGRLTFHESFTGLVSQAIALMHLQQGCVVIPTNSRSFSETVYRHLTQIFGEEGILLVNSENSESAAVQHVTVHINEELPKLRAVICSPSYSTGLDVTAPVRGVCGIFFQQPTLPSDNLQMMGRYRNAQERHVYVQPCERDLITDEQILLKHELAQSMRTAVAADFVAHDLPAVSPEQAEILRLQCRYEAAHNRQRQNMLASFVVLAQAEGYEIAQQEGENITLGTQLKQAREAVAAERKERTLTAEPVTREALDSHRHHGTLTPLIRAGHERYLIEDTIGLMLTAELYDRFRRPEDRRALRRFTDLTVPRETLQQRDRAQASGQILIRQRSHYTEAQAIVAAVMELLDFAEAGRPTGSPLQTTIYRGGDALHRPGTAANNPSPEFGGGREEVKTTSHSHILNSTGQINSPSLPAGRGSGGGVISHSHIVNQVEHQKSPSPFGEGGRGVRSAVVLREAEIEHRTGEYIRANLHRIQRVIDHRYDLSAETLPVVKRILKSVGLTLSGKQVMVDRERYYVYWLDTDQLARMEMYAAARRVYLVEKGETITQNTRMNIRNTRVLSNRITTKGGFPQNSDKQRAMSHEQRVKNAEW